MSSASALVELGERYAALGLAAAARSAFERALAVADENDPVPARRLAELALSAGDARAARTYAADAGRRDPGPAARLLSARAQLAAGELDAARFSFGTVLESAGVTPLLRARALLGRSAVASAESDEAGAAATAMAALDDLCSFASAPGAENEAELALADEIFARVAATGRGIDGDQRIAELASAQPGAPHDLFRAALLAARQAHGEDVAIADIEAALEQELLRRPESRPARLRLIESRLRRRYRDESARAKAIGDLEALAEEMAGDVERVDSAALARVYFLLAAAYEDDPATVGQAEQAYERGLQLRPGHAAAANKLALLRLARGDNHAALLAIERALRIDSGHGLAWRNAARVLEASLSATAVHDVVGRILEAAQPGAGTAAGGVAPRLVTATAEVTRGDVLAGMHTRGHRLKNLLGIVGSRTRSARKMASGELATRLESLEREVTALYDEWAAYLRSMQTVGPVVEVVPVAPLVVEAIEAARGDGGVPIQVDLAGGLDDLRGDRLLLREALVNVMSNAVEACGDTGGRVAIRVRQVPAGGANVIEVEVADTGPGIPTADLVRVFAPGYTTKESGSGIGLAVAERVVVAHHGRISVDSEPGRGTTIIIALPSDLGGFATLAAFSPEGDGA